jgi:hypothetical protein
MTIAITIGLMVAIMALTLVNQQIAFTRIFNTQSFLTNEAPMISETLAKICSRADGFRLYGSKSNALAGTGAVMTDATVAELRFRTADGNLQRALLSWEDPGSGSVLNYYLVSSGGTIGTPNLQVTGKPSQVRFGIEGGLLRVRLTGPSGEEITYCATTQT